MSSELLEHRLQPGDLGTLLSVNPVEIAHYDPPPLSETELVLGGVWSAYRYNGKIYGSDITRGLDVFQLSDPLVAPAQHIRFDRFNAQSQPSY